MPPLTQWARWEGPRRFHGTRRRGCGVSRLLVRTRRESLKAYGQEWITEMASSPPDAPHRLKSHHQKRRAGHLQDRPWSRADARRADWLLWRDRPGGAGAHRASAEGLAP
ncbi:hypothetical protein CB0101_12040 [Synechococcus sp. CB0101]|uniref:hypothetical protein n=1 Tax=Synechococcus sp. CB0101 TaxID=232348 RepID=UPI0010AB3978|nr:hypothetical protein [Synechococcus sp. CB0101]QCH15553.1 hypothetical protein CB0101_12040 [Synechococcus sp. CB0101]